MQGVSDGSVCCAEIISIISYVSSFNEDIYSIPFETLHPHLIRCASVLQSSSFSLALLTSDQRKMCK